MKNADKLGETLQQDALAVGIVSGVGTLVAPESGIKVGLPFAAQLYSLGSLYRSSASLARAFSRVGNGSGAGLGELNDFAMRAVGVPDRFKPFVDKVLERAEHSAGLDKGDGGECK